MAEINNFIHNIIDKDLEAQKYGDKVHTRFPPEHNGYLHIGHAKSICLNFTTAQKYGGKCNLRYDDTNPVKEDMEYVNSIEADVRWLGFEWEHRLWASDYFDEMYECAVKLIKDGKAYVCDLNADQIREYRGTLKEPGKESPYRNRSIEENRELFKRMTNGEFENGARVLRAKIDMASSNLNMRDPVIYRIIHAANHRTGNKWCVYPMYDFAHPLSDAKEGVTHSLCSLEFENHRPHYNWFLEKLNIPTPPRQIEFARMNVNYTLTSKRKCLKLVTDNIVDGWNDPRMATLCGMRRRGYPASAIRAFCEKIGVSKAHSVIDYALLESCVRDDLNLNAERTMAVLEPLKIIVDNYPEGKVEELEVEINPNKPELGTRKITFSREIFIERSDFELVPPPKYFRLCPEKEVRLKSAYFVKYASHETDENGNITAVHVTYDPATKGGDAPDGRKVKGTLHWVNAGDAVDVTVKLYERLFNVENPSDEEGVSSFKDNLNPESLKVLTGAKCEPIIKTAPIGTTYQFMRQGYFCIDTDSTPDNVIINRTVALKDSFTPKK